jgi:sodium/proline symporter
MASTETLITFGIYLVAMLGIGIAGYFSTKNLDDYILGGRSLGGFVTALSAGASDMSGWLLMGLPGAIFAFGLSKSWIAIGLLIGAYLNWRLVAARLRIYTEYCNDSLTLPEYLNARFEDKANLIKIITAVVIIIFFTLYCASGVVAGAKLFQSTFGWSYQTCLFLGTAATIAYVLIGGFLAISWTDTIQASMMFTALIITPAMVIFSSGGLHSSIEHVRALNEAYVSLTSNVKPLTIIALLGWGLGYFGQPHILVRFMAIGSVKDMATARRIGMTWMFLCLAGAIAVGFFGIAFYSGHQDLLPAVAAEPETIFIQVTSYLFNPWIYGTLLAAILGAIMSSLSCQLLVTSSALTEDIYKTFLRKNASQKELVFMGRATVLLVALIAIALAWNPDSSILDMVSYAWAGFGSAFGPLIIISLFWSRVNKSGALAGMIVGTVAVLLGKQLHWFDLLVPGFILSSLAIIIVSLLTAKPSQSMLDTFAKVEDKMKQN